MVPTARTVREGKYVTTGGVVKFDIGQSGSIVFVTAITASLPAGRYVMRAHLERDDPVEPNREPDLLGTNIALWRRRIGVGIDAEHLLEISGQQSLPVLGSNGVYVVDSSGENFPNGISIQDYFYWIQLEVQQTPLAPAGTRNSVIGIELLGRVS